MSVHLIIKSLLRRKVVTALLLLQLAVTLGLVVNSLLLASAARDLVEQPTGLALEQILTVRVKPTSASMRIEPALSEVISRQLAAIRLIPGVEAAEYANQTPLRQGARALTCLKLTVRMKVMWMQCLTTIQAARFFRCLALS